MTTYQQQTSLLKSGRRLRQWLGKKAYNVEKDIQVETLNTALIGIALACSVCGILWSLFIYSHCGPILTSYIPILFTIVVLPATVYSKKTNSYRFLAWVQCLLIIIVPSAIQFSLGANYSGAVMLWGIIAPLTALFYLTQLDAILLLSGFIITFLLSVILEVQLTEDSLLVDFHFMNEFYLMNLLIPALLVISAVWFILQRLQLNQSSRFKLISELNKKHNDLLSGISYAQRLQSASIPKFQQFRNHLKNSFYITMPKQIVSGDYFWWKLKDDSLYFALADCTGHGVPGALMTEICNNALSQVLEENITEVGEILNETKRKVIQTFADDLAEIRDGMDISLCCIQGNHLLFSGAKQSIFIHRNSSNTIERIQGNRQSIGNDQLNYIFTTHVRELNRGDSIYITTDGYLDQFGGQHSSKFKRRNFEKLLLHIANHSLPEKELAIRKAIVSWMGDEDQVDDISVFGVTI